MGRVRVIDRATQAPVEIDEAELDLGRHEVRGSGRVVAADGRVFEAPDLAVALSETGPDGRPLFSLDTPDRAEERRLQREYGNSPVTAAAAGAARGATLGLSDVVGGALGADEALRELQERNPEASIAGEVGGTIAPLLLSGGAAAPEVGATTGARLLGGAARVGRAVTAPVRGLAALSEGAGAATARAIAGAEATAGRRLLGRAAGGAVEGAIEGGAGEAAQMLSEEALGNGDPNLTADLVIARLGRGALLGGTAGTLLGGGLGLAGEGVRGAARLGREGTDLLRRGWQQQTGTELAPGVAELASNSFARAAALASGADPAIVARFTDLGPDGQAARRIVDEGAERTYGASTRRITSALDRAMPLIDNISEEAIGIRKLDDIARVVRTDNFADQLAAGEGAIARVRTIADDIAGNESTYGIGSMGARRRMLQSADEAESRLIQALDEANPQRRSALVQAAIDNLKRQVGTRAMRHMRERYGREALTNLYERDLRTLLEDTALWGDGIRGLQTETNAGWHRYLNWDGDFSRMLTRDGEAVGFDRVRATDSARLYSYATQIGEASNASREQIFRDWIDGAEGLTDTIGRHYDLTPQARADLDEFRAAMREVRDAHEELVQRGTVLSQWGRISGNQSGGALAASLAGGGAAAMALGGGIAGAPLALAGTTLGLASSPARTIKMMTAVERLARGTSNDIGEGLRRFLSGARRRASEAGRRTRRAATAGTVTAYRERIRQLEEDQRDSEGTARRVADSTRELTHGAPMVQQSMQLSSGRALGALASARPQGRIAPGTLWAAQRESLPSRDEIEAFLRTARTIDDPMTLMADLEERSLRPEQVDVLRQVYPSLYAEIVRQAYEAIAESPTEPSYQDRLQLGILLGIPTDPSLVPANLAILQSAHATAPQTSQGTTHQAPQLAESMQSPTQRLEARR